MHGMQETLALILDKLELRKYSFFYGSNYILFQHMHFHNTAES